MTVDAETTKLCNLLHGSPTFAMLEDRSVRRIDRIEPSHGLTTVAGTTFLRDGREVPSVFSIDGATGEVFSSIWLWKGSWIDSADREQRCVVGTDDQLFPYDWSTAVPLASDHLHE